MGEWREVSARSDRAPARHVRQDTTADALEQELNRLDTCAGRPLRQRIRAQEHRRTDDLGGIRLAHAARMTAQQAKL